MAQVRQHKVVNGPPDQVEGAEATEATEVGPHPVDKATIHAAVRCNERGLCPKYEWRQALQQSGWQTTVWIRPREAGGVLGTDG